MQLEAVKVAYSFIGSVVTLVVLDVCFRLLAGTRNGLFKTMGDIYFGTKLAKLQQSYMAAGGSGGNVADQLAKMMKTGAPSGEATGSQSLGNDAGYI